METQHFSIQVNAPAAVVWQTMFDASTYRQWTSVFNPDSYFEGSWLPGSEIRFLGSNPDGGMNGLNGMYGVITEHRPYEFVLIEYQGQIVNDVDDTTSREARQLIGAREAYSFSETDGTTTVTIDVDTADTYAELFGEFWPKGLAKLKGLAEAAGAERADRSYTPRMETMHFSTRINAPAEIVWETMLDDATYRQWTSVFNPGSYFLGSWLPGSEIRFFGNDENGKMGGMVGVIVEHRPHEFLSIEYRGQIVDGIEDTTSDDAKRLIGTHENYTFTQTDGVTTLTVDVDVDDEWAGMFGEQWPLSLAKLTELAEAEVATRGQHPAD